MMIAGLAKPNGGAPSTTASPIPARTPRLRRVLVGTDVGAATAAWASAVMVEPPGRAGLPTAAMIALLVAGTVAALHLNHLYLARICRIRSVEVSRLARATATVGASAYLVGGRVPLGLAAPLLVRGSLISFLALAVSRSMYASWVRRRRTLGRVSQPLVVVGANDEGADLARLFERHPELGFTVAGVVDDPDTVEAHLMATGSQSVVVAVSAFASTELNRLTRRLLAGGTHVHLSCGLTGIDHRRIRQTPMAHEPIFYLEPAAASRTQLAVRRAIDIVGSLAGIVVSLPVMALAALAIRAHDKGPALFQHERIGRGGRPFTIYKLRTMVPGAERMQASVEEANHRDGPLFKAKNDPRVTRVGRILRATSIDELPQLVNVLMGSMSLVGPRPALAHEVERFDPELLTRLRVKPGITGLWQVEARHDPSFDSYRRLDLFYLENWSLDLDLVILWSTAKGLLGQAVRDLKGQWRSPLSSPGPAPMGEGSGSVRELGAHRPHPCHPVLEVDAAPC